VLLAGMQRTRITKEQGRNIFSYVVLVSTKIKQANFKAMLKYGYCPEADTLLSKADKVIF
jgi:hypothetical protein